MIPKEAIDILIIAKNKPVKTITSTEKEAVKEALKASRTLRSLTGTHYSTNGLLLLLKSNYYKNGLIKYLDIAILVLIDMDKYLITELKH